LLVTDAAGEVVRRTELDGVPTAPPAIVGRSVWVPLSGYRLAEVKLP